MNCAHCDKPLGTSRSSRQQTKYCSIKCQIDHQYDLYIQSWLQDREDGMRGQTLISKHIRRWLFEQRGEACWKCNWNVKHPDSGVCPLEVDHIDGCHRNNRPDNLRLLCPNCHSLTSTYKNRNKGKGRAHRRERYAEGKSY